ncbi:HinfI family type II restriction enzyme [Helicobacter bizzozeronii]|uniref:HinfI family type II restriction enzyme n=1 Tax=Helicobacter bizzozeronii TaxID=56877 RepID=UPI000CEE8187|nr:restriction endonuclease [Helicobacter bizzozeronii]
MPNDFQVLIHASVQEILQNCTSPEKLKELTQTHQAKLHFIPTKYRILGGLLQSMNIQFGNLLKVLMKNLIVKEQRYEILEQYSGQEKNKFTLSKTNETLIDQYITQRQAENLGLENAFKQLCAQIFSNNQRTDTSIHVTHDIDLLFKDKERQKIYYIEIKYNDDHDTDKFEGINRKFIKTYACLLRALSVKTPDALVPILFYFNDKKREYNKYIPEHSHIYRGKRFFDTFLSTSYTELESYLADFCNNPKNIQAFDVLYSKICLG